MAFVIRRSDSDWIELSFENEVSLWSILKTLSKTPYLKSYIVDKYDGGNTQIDVEYWDTEEIMYRELSKGKYLFPYESIGFILDDSIADIELSIIDEVNEKAPEKSKVEFRIVIKDTDQISIFVPGNEHIPALVSLYLFSVFDTGYDHVMMFTLSQGLKGLIKGRMLTLDIVEGTFKVRLDAMHFVLQFQEDNGNLSYFYIKLGKHFHKKVIQEKNIKNLNYLKKKFINKIELLQKVSRFLENHTVLRILIKLGLWALLIFLVLWLVPKIAPIRQKKLIPIVAGIFILWGMYRLVHRYIRRNIHKRYLKNNS